MKILIVSPYFTPYTGVGALRMTSLARYLKQQGDTVTVLKATDASYPPTMATGQRVEGVCLCEYPMDEVDCRASSVALEQRLDALLAAESFDCMLATFGPYETANCVLSCEKKYPVPLVVDFRDLWVYDSRPCPTLRSRLLWLYRYLRSKRRETALLRLCDRFVTVTPRSVATMEKHYPFLRGKSACIYNGYTPVPLPPRQPRENASQDVVICALGKFSYYTAAGAAAFLTATQRLREEGHPVVIHHYGTPEPTTAALCRQFGISACAECGQLPYGQAMEAAAKADICAIVIDYAEGLGTKVFDYILLNRPIVVYAPPHSEAEELLQGAENAYFCQTAEQIHNAISAIIQKKQTHLTEDAAFSRQFSREVQNQRYRALLQEVCSATHRKETV